MNTIQDGDDVCWAAGCNKPSTHTLTTRVLPDEAFPEGWLNEVRYCLNDALYFAAWLPYCYPDQYELVSIMPPASEL
jgi:hypothetical protein